MTTEQKQADEQNFPVFSILTQYIKDLSFENPMAPQSLAPKQTPPALDMNVNVTSTRLNDTDHEVVLEFHARAEFETQILFNIELQYAGVFQLKNIPEQEVQPLLFIEGARLLFPFAREIIASSTANGGFVPLFIEPINFAALYQNSLQEQTTDATKIN